MKLISLWINCWNFESSDWIYYFVFFTAPVVRREVMFSCVCSGIGVPHLHPITLPTSDWFKVPLEGVPGTPVTSLRFLPEGMYPSDWFQIPSWGGGGQDWDTPWLGLGYPHPQTNYAWTDYTINGTPLAFYLVCNVTLLGQMYITLILLFFQTKSSKVTILRKLVFLVKPFGRLSTLQSPSKFSWWKKSTRFTKSNRHLTFFLRKFPSVCYIFWPMTRMLLWIILASTCK